MKVITAILAVLALTLVLSTPAAANASGGGWTTYMNGVAHTGYTRDSTINRQNAGHLQVRWAVNPSADQRFDSIFSQPVVSRGRVFVGAWDGYEYALNRSGGVAWKTFVGQTVDLSGCVPPKAGVSSTATVGQTRIGQSMRDVLYVGGGDASFYALDAGTGQILWKTPLGSSPSHYLWSSSVLYNGSVYTGVASFGDCPEVQGQVVKLNAATGAIEAVFNVVPDGCRGGAVWSTPTIDPRDGMLYITTGNPENTGPVVIPCEEPYALSFVKLRADDLSYVSHWRIPPDLRVFDSDFGATPTLFTDRNGRRMVGAENKDGYFYALDRDHLSDGMVWRAQVSVGGPCPQCGTAAIAPAAFDGASLYVAAGKTTIDGQSCGGSVRALDPADGSFRWQQCLNDQGTAGMMFPPSVLGAVTVNRDVAIVGAGRAVVVLDKASGAILRNVIVSGGDQQPPPPYFWGSASLSDGVIYAGNMSGTLVAIAPGA